MRAERNLLSIGEVARATGLRPSALRFYEEQGLIRPAGRVGGRRHYHPSTLRRLALVALCQDVGFTVAEIADLLGRPAGGRERWRRVAERKLADIDAHIERAQVTRRLLHEVLACGCGDLASCEMVSDAARRRLQSLGAAAASRAPRRSS